MGLTKGFVAKLAVFFGSGVLLAVPVSAFATATQLSFENSAYTVGAGSCGADVIEVHRLDSSGSEAYDGTSTTVVMAGPGVQFYSDWECTMPVDSGVIPAGESQVNFYFSAIYGGSNGLIASATGLTTATQTETITGGATMPVGATLAFENTPVTEATGTCGTDSIQVHRLMNGYEDFSGSSATVSVSATGVTFYSDWECTSVVTSGTIPAGQSQVNFYFSATTSGAKVVTASSSGYTSVTQTQTVTSPAPNPVSLAFANSPYTSAAGTCGAYVLEVNRLMSGSPDYESYPLTVHVASPGVTFYSDWQCTMPVVSADISATQSQVNFYYLPTYTGSNVITVSATGYVPASQTETVTGGTTLSSNYDHIKTGLIAYEMDYYTSGLQSTVMSWLANRIDFFVGGSVDPTTYNTKDKWTSYVESAYVYANEIYSTVKASAADHSFDYENALLHMNADYQVSSGLTWTHMDQFDSFEQTEVATSGSPSSAVNGAFLLNGSTYTDITVSAYAGSVNNTISDRLLLGYGEPFDQANFNIATAGSKTVSWKYWNGSAWSTLTTTSDSTSSLSTSGQVLFTPPSDWAPNSVNGSKTKYWIEATISGSGTNPVVSKIYGDNWLVTSGTNNSRGWSSTSSSRVNVGLGNLEYNPTPPSGSSAKFRYQARVTGYYAPNIAFGNPGDIVSSVRSWAYVLEDKALVVNGSSGDPNGIMFDDGLSQPQPVSPSSVTGSNSDLGSDTWLNDGTAVYSAVVADLHSALGSNFNVGVNSPYLEFAQTGNWSLDEQASLDNKTNEAPIALQGSGQTGQQSYDGYLAANNSNGTAGLFASWGSSYFGVTLYDGTWLPWDEANRGPITALASYYVAANPNTYFLYNGYGWSYLETDEFYYWSSPTTTTASISTASAGTTTTIYATDVSAFTSLPIENGIVVQIGTDIVVAQRVNSTTLTTTSAIHNSYASGTSIASAISAHQSTTATPALSNIWKWGPWFPAIGVDVGIPDTSGYNSGARNLSWISGSTASGNSTACASTYCSPVWRRDYTKAMILSRPLDWNSPASEVTTYSNSISLGGTYYPLNADGTSGAGITSIQLRGGESAILLKNPL